MVEFACARGLPAIADAMMDALDSAEEAFDSFAVVVAYVMGAAAKNGEGLSLLHRAVQSQSLDMVQVSQGRNAKVACMSDSAVS